MKEDTFVNADEKETKLEVPDVGTVFDLDELNPGTWFKFDEDNQKSADICVRALNPEKFEEIQRVTVKVRPIYKQGQRFEIREVNDKLQNELIWDYCIVDWKNVYDRTNKVIPCTKENKILLMQRSLTFFTRVTKLIQEVNELLSLTEKEEEKN